MFVRKKCCYPTALSGANSGDSRKSILASGFRRSLSDSVANHISPVPDDSRILRHRALHDAEYVGTIEVVVLRCSPASEEPPVAKRARGNASANLQFKAATGPSGSSYDDKQNSNSDSFIGTMFDGANDRLLEAMSLGGDGSWDEPQTQQGGPQRWAAQMTGPNTGIYRPQEEAPSGTANQVYGQNQIRFNQDWSDRNNSPSSPQAHASEWITRADNTGFIQVPAAPPSHIGNISHQGNTENAWAGAGPVATVPTTPAVVINGESVLTGMAIIKAETHPVTHRPPQAPMWGGSRQSLVSKKTTDSWASRKTPYEESDAGGNRSQAQNATRNTWTDPTLQPSTANSNELQHHTWNPPNLGSNDVNKPLDGPLNSSWHSHGRGVNASPNEDDWRPLGDTAQSQNRGWDSSNSHQHGWNTNQVQGTQATSWDNNNDSHNSEQQQQDQARYHWNEQGE